MQAVCVAKVRGREYRTYRVWCTYCKSHFMAHRAGRVTCGQPACRKAHNLTTNRPRSRAYFQRNAKVQNCLYCKAEFKTISQKRVTCGRPKCQSKRNIDYNYWIQIQPEYWPQLRHYQARRKAMLLMHRELENLAGI